MPTVTIGIPTRDRADTLERALRSCAEQTHRDLQIVVSDNASTDHTADVLRRWASKDHRVRVLRQSVNIGREQNFNAVLNAADGDYFMWLSDDDHLAPEYIERCSAVLTSNPGCVAAMGTVTYGQAATPETAAAGLASPDAGERVASYLQTVRLNAEHYSVMRRADAVRSYYPSTLAGDWMFVAQLAVVGKILDARGAHLHRSIGVSADLADLASSYGMRPAWGREKDVWIVRLFVPALLGGRGTFRELSIRQRCNTAATIIRTFTRRWWHTSGRQRLGLHWAGRARRRLLR